MTSPAETAAKKLAWDMGSWRSIDLRLREDFENMDPARDAGQPRTYHSVCHYIETATGQRMLEERIVPDGGKDAGKTMLEIYYADGSRSAQLLRTDQGDAPGREQVAIKRAFSYEERGITHRPAPLRYLYVGLEPLPEALPRAVYLGEGRQLGRPCDRFLFSHVKSQPDAWAYVYWLDRAAGIPLRVEFYEDAEARAAERPATLWVAESLDEVEGHHLALKSEMTFFKAKGADPRQAHLRVKTVTDEIHFDREYPKATFWPKITKETTVVDFIKSEIISPKSVPKVTVPNDPIRAVDPGGGEASLTAGVMLLGTVLVGVGALLWWRRR